MEISRRIYQIFLISNCVYIIENTQTDKNSTDVIVKYSGHTDLERPVQNKPEPDITEPKYIEPVTDVFMLTDSMVFIRNDKPVIRNYDFNGVKIEDLLKNNDLKDKIYATKTDSPNADILFISGKNKEQKLTQDKTQEKKVKKNTVNKRLDCSTLNCNNTINSICGSREENKKPKYRLFLNKCFFRKVNCGFQNEYNRYNQVPLENCKYTGVHFLSRPYEFKPIPLPEPIKTPRGDNRRSFSSRRSLNMGVDGHFCSHPCPVSCTEDYDPQCAVSSSGRRNVFLNHCKLDYNSCMFKVVWHLRPLSDCVGGRKADMTQNRGFIGWMQRVGIVDRRGRLVLS